MTFPILPSSGSSSYNLTKSLRFRATASSGLSRTFGTATDGKKFYLAAIIKRGVLSSGQAIISSYTGDVNNYSQIVFDTPDTLVLFNKQGGVLASIATNAVFRDPSSWYCLEFLFDSTLATESDRMQIWVNGVRQVVTGTYPALNTIWHGNTNGNPNKIGGNPYANADYLITEIYGVDGQSLTLPRCGSVNTLTGVWQPARYNGLYGANGFYLPVTDNSALTTSSNVGLGADYSGNGNYWITNNISITAGVTYDSMTDVPTLTSETASNFAVLNPLKSNLAGGDGSLLDGNLKLIAGNNTYWNSSMGTISIPSGKWYWEGTLVAGGYTTYGIYLTDAVLTDDMNLSTNYLGYNASNGNKYSGGSGAAYGATFAAGDVIGIAFDSSAGSLTFYKNNTSQGVAFTGITGNYSPATGAYFTATQSCTNFGQRPFTYTPPTGFKSLNTFNLPDSTILQGNKVMDATKYTGNSSTLNVINAGSFKPDFVWIKSRTVAYANYVFDSVRGVTKSLATNTTDIEDTISGVTAFNSNGFTLGADDKTNYSSLFVGWQWQAGQGTNVTNTNGSITSTVSVNASAGFSVVTYTGTGTTATVGHGLGVAPSMIVVKSRTYAGQSWPVYTIGVGNAAVLGAALFLNDGAAAITNQSGYFGTVDPTSSVFTVGGADSTSRSGETYVAYCWTPIAGYSAFGKYLGNGSTNGPFIYTGFRPKFILLKTTLSIDSWYMLDTSRSPVNVGNHVLYSNSAVAEGTVTVADILSNGFKLRSTTDGNASGGNYYIYAAFAENPFKNSLAR